MRFFFFMRRAPVERELAPDEIFLDASNLPKLDQSRLEGRLEQPISRTAYLGIGFSIIFILGIFFIQAFYLQILHGTMYALQSEQNRIRPEILFPKRGALVDRNGATLVQNEATEDGFIRRVYQTPGFAHLLGYVSYPKKDTSGNYYDIHITGIAGVEKVFDDRLRGENGLLLIEEDALGNTHSQGSVIAPIDGENLALSIDARAQTALYDAISELAERIPYQGGAGVLMDVDTGEVYALVSYPEYDPNVLSLGKPVEVIEGYLSDARRPYLNRPVTGLYTPGSIVKPMIAVGALEDGVITPEKEIISSGFISVPNPYDPEKPTIFRDWKAHGATDMRQAIAFSSDVYFYTIGGGFGEQRGLGIERLAYWYRVFGFESETGTELSQEETGFVPTPVWKEETFNEPWRIGNTYHTAIGQYAMQITVLEAARAVAAIANGGRLVTPTVLLGSRRPSEPISVSQESFRIVREGMRLGVTEGTSLGLNAYPYVHAAGKTGTAELGTSNEFRNSWSIGFFPYDHPKYAFAIVMEKGPAGNAVGGIYVMSRVFETLRQTAPEYFNE